MTLTDLNTIRSVTISHLTDKEDSLEEEKKEGEIVRVRLLPIEARHTWAT